MAYSKEDRDRLVEEVCSRIEEGKSLNSILPNKDREEGLPSKKAFELWLDKDQKYLRRYIRATNKRADALFEEILDIAEDQSRDIMQGKESPMSNHAAIARDRLRIDTRKWMMGKMNPKKYNDKYQEPEEENNEQPLFPD